MEHIDDNPFLAGFHFLRKAVLEEIKFIQIYHYLKEKKQGEKKETARYFCI